MMVEPDSPPRLLDPPRREHPSIDAVVLRHHPRTAGQTKYNITRTFRVILDLITVKFLHSYVTRPMHVMGLAGLGSMGLGLVTLLVTLVMKYTGGPGMTANPLFLLGVMLELIGVQFISMGLIGELMTRTYFESQGKKAYTVRKALNDISAASARKLPAAPDTSTSMGP